MFYLTNNFHVFQMKKIFWILGIGLLALIIAVVTAVGVYIGPIVKIGMEEIGPKITQVSIKVDVVNVSLLTGTARVQGLIVGNPGGYKLPEAIKAGTVDVSVDPFSVLSSKIIVHSVQIRSPEITFEGGIRGNNLSKIMDNVNAHKNEADNKPAPKMEVDDFLITGAKVHVSLTGLVSKEMTLPLPDIHLTDLGKGSNGLTPVELTRAVLDAIVSDTIKAVTHAVTEVGRGAENIGKGTGKTVGEDINRLSNSIGGLFGK